MEFMNSIEIVDEHKGRPDEGNFVIKNPLVGLQERIDLLKRTQDEIDKFNKRIHNYYDLKTKTWRDGFHFIASFGDHDRFVSLSKPYGGGGSIYHIMIDDYYFGVVQLREGKWMVLLQNKGDMTIDDTDAISDLIEEYEQAINDK